MDARAFAYLSKRSAISINSHRMTGTVLATDPHLRVSELHAANDRRVAGSNDVDESLRGSVHRKDHFVSFPDVHAVGGGCSAYCSDWPGGLRRESPRSAPRARSGNRAGLRAAGR